MSDTPPPDMSDDQPHLERVDPPGVFRVARVTSSGNWSRRGQLGVVTLVGLVGFLAGVQLGPRQSPPADGPPLPSSTIQGLSSQAPTRSGPVPGTSGFRRTLRPDEIIARFAGGSICTTDMTDTLTQPAPGLGPSPAEIYTAGWTISCPVPAARQESVLDQFTNAIGQSTPGTSWTSSADAHGTTVAAFPYADGAFAGIVTVVASAVAKDLEISLTLQEWVAP